MSQKITSASIRTLASSRLLRGRYMPIKIETLRKYLTSILLGVLLVGCVGEDKLEIPNSEDIKEISITHSEGEKQIKRVISEKSDINKITSFIGENNSKWRKNWNTIPAPQYIASAKNYNGTVIALIYIDKNWVAVQFGVPYVKASSLYFWEIGDEKRVKFYQLLGISI